MSDKLIIAAASSGKTTYLVKSAIGNKEGKILITTFTNANEQEIRKKFFHLHGFVPGNITIQPWFSFLLQHGVRPFQGCMFKEQIEGLVLINGQSVQGIAETNIAKHYFTKDKKIYSDKISKFAVKSNERTKGDVLNRLSKIYSDIYIDEIQDLSGYDLDFLRLLFNSPLKVTLVGDPRQGTYSTNDSRKNAKHKKSQIVNFFEDKTITIEKDETSLVVNYRCNEAICNFSNLLFPQYTKTTSGQTKTTQHDGIFLVKKKDVEAYLQEYKPQQLRERADSKGVNPHFPVMNFGKSKGLEFDRVLIYPTKPFLDWLKDNSHGLQPTSRSKFYVAITRAIYSVGIVCDEEIQIDGIQLYIPK